jgi:tetratricopeptide (TPR) repeat protein
MVSGPTEVHPMRTSTLFLALCYLAVAGICSASENPGTKAGWQYLRDGDYARAERVFEQVLNSDPHDLKAWEGYRMAFQKRKAQEEGRVDSEPVVPPDAQPPSDGAARSKRPTKLAKKSEDDGSSDSSSGGKDSSTASGDKSDKSSEDKEELEDLIKIDPSALRNSKKAKERFEKYRDELTQTYRRSHAGVTEVHSTFYSTVLYRLLCERLGAEKGYSYDKTQKLYEATIKDMRGQLEFYVKLINYSSKPKQSVPIGNIVKKTTLVDDDGNSYDPDRWKAPKGTQLLGDDAYTVWFSRTDSEGADIIKKAGKGNLYLVIADLPFESKQIQITFPVKKLTSQTIGRMGSEKGWMDKIKNLWK